MPTIATLLSAKVDYSRADLGLSLGATLVVAKTIGRVAVYGNGFAICQETPGPTLLPAHGYANSLR